jgi:hypothetical protein
MMALLRAEVAAELRTESAQEGAGSEPQEDSDG